MAGHELLPNRKSAAGINCAVGFPGGQIYSCWRYPGLDALLKIQSWALHQQGHKVNAVLVAPSAGLSAALVSVPRHHDADAAGALIHNGPPELTPNRTADRWGGNK